jgi:hypothetical protein
MQIDMHFYGVYALCRLAGINSENAHIIAYASQFVDDKIKGENIVFRKSQKALRPVMTSHKPIDYLNAIYEDQWKVWTTFHFLPGNEPADGTFEEKMICQRNSKLAKLVLRNAEDNITKPYGLYLAGIASHSFADTFSHFGFIGISTDWNKVKQGSTNVTGDHDPSIIDYVTSKYEKFINNVKTKFAELVPVGHGAVATYPDRPYLKWEFEYEEGNRGIRNRDNWDDFYFGAQLLHQFYIRLLKNQPTLGDINHIIEWNDFGKEIRSILKHEAEKSGRIRKWKEFIKNNSYFEADEVDKKIDYKEMLLQINSDSLKIMEDNELYHLPIYHFMEAAKSQIYLVSNYLKTKGITF